MQSTRSRGLSSSTRWRRPSEFRRVRWFTYNFGCAVGGFFPAAIGFLAASIGLTAALAFGTTFAYGLALVPLLFPPETKGKELVVFGWHESF